MTRREKLMHPATFISLAALFVALGGVGYAATKIGTKQLKNRAVTGPKLANNSVTSPKIRARAVRNGDLANNSVSSSKIRNGAIISADLAVGSVLNQNLGNGAVTSGKIANDTIATGNLANGSVASEKIGTAAVVASKLAANSVTNPAIAPDSITAAQIANGQVVEGNGALSSVEVQLPNGATNSPVLSFPGLGVLQADCPAGFATLKFLNNSAPSVDLRLWGVIEGAVPGSTEPTPIIAAGNLANGFLIEQESGPQGTMGSTWMASFGLGTNLHLATINTSTSLGTNDTCAISAQATYTS
jgi:trimeric autotransporter adhesin